MADDKNWVQKTVDNRRQVRQLAKTKRSEMTSNTPRQIIKAAKQELRSAKLSRTQAKKEYRFVRKQGESEDVQHTALQKLEDHKINYKATKKAKTQTVNNVKGGSLKKRMAKKGYVQARNYTEAAASNDDVLADMVQARQKIRQANANAAQAKRVSKYAARGSKRVVKNTYGLANRTYNFARGKGFVRTAKANRWETKLASQLKRMRRRIARTHLGRTSRVAGKVVSTTGRVVSKPFLTILKNPLSAKAVVIGGLIVLVLSMFAGTTTTMEQDEFELNKAWLYMTEMDRTQSNDKVDYWTDIDSVMTYMNYQFGDYKVDDVYKESSSSLKDRTNVVGQSSNDTSDDTTYKDLLRDVWNSLNQDTSDLKTMQDVYKTEGSIFTLSGDALSEYESIMEEGAIEGYYGYLQELGNPFYQPTDQDNYDSPLVILKRFGNTSEDDVYNGSLLKASAGQELLAVMSGKITVDGSDVIIKTSDAEFTYKKVEGIRYKTGDKVSEGDVIGTVKSSSGQEVYYKKLEEKATKDKEAKWTYVNVGFYFQLVTYNQTTSVMSDLDISGDLATRAKAVSDYIKQKVPEATDNGIAAMLGNFATESNITAKRAEGDYLDPPVGASDTSWDDETWLSISGPEIYNGAYANILHRGLGLGQWTDTADGSTRHTLLLQYAAAQGKKWYDLELQIDFILEGDSPYYTQIAKEILTSSDDVATLTKKFLNNWEGNQGDKLAERQNNANQILTYLTQKSSGTTGSTGTEASSFDFPSGWENKLVYGKPSTASMTTQAGNGYPVGQCTWYVANRLVETGLVGNALSSNNGNGGDWVASLVAKGWTYSSVPKAGAVMSVVGGFDGTYSSYGHVAFVEAVNDDGTFLISECNYDGVQDKVHYRVLTVQNYYTFAIAP
ncbi:phage tail tip lysozyme [Streptococcus dentiloxodontae]